LRRLAATATESSHLLFPCRCAGLEMDVPVSFLDAGPPQMAAWTLVGCQRSLEIHRGLYGADPAAQIDFCPRRRSQPGSGREILKCCLLERGVEQQDGSVVV